MNEVEIKLTEDEYKTLIQLLYFSDYCANAGLISWFKATVDRNRLFDILGRIYQLGDNLSLLKSGNLSSLVSEVRFSEEEGLKRKQQVENDLNYIAMIILAQEFAKRDLNLPHNDWMFDYEGGWMNKDKLIVEHMQPFLKEFKENGFSNLRFKMFHQVPS